MGTFLGHVSPGLAFFTFGLLWAVKYCYLHQKKSYVRKTCYFGRTFEQKVTKLRLEAIIKIVYGVIAASAEFIVPGEGVHFFNEDGTFFHGKNWQHFTIYSYFAMSGIFDLLSQVHFKHRATRLETLFLALAFGIEAHMLYNHRLGKSLLENSVHIFVFTSCLLCFLMTLAEVWNENADLLPFLRTGFAILQGTWLFHGAFIIYRPISGIPWDEESHASVMFVNVMYCWHMILVMIILTVVHGTIYICFGRNWRKTQRVCEFSLGDSSDDESKFVTD